MYQSSPPMSLLWLGDCESVCLINMPIWLTFMYSWSGSHTVLPFTLLYGTPLPLNSDHFYICGKLHTKTEL